MFGDDVAVLLGHETDVAGLRTAIGSLLSDESYSRAAARLRAEISAAPSPSELVRTLERIAVDRETVADVVS